jgi:uncharacterized protein (DUF885 family)
MRALRAFLLPLTLLGATMGLAWTAAAEPPTALYTDYWRDRLRLHPGEAVQLGDRRGLSRFDESLQDHWRQDLLDTLGRYDAQVRKIDLTSLNRADQRSLSILRQTLDEDLAYYGSPLFEVARRLPTEHFQGPHLVYAQDAAGSGAVPFKTVADYDLALVRADAFSRWVDDAIGRLQEGAKTGVVLPRMVVERMLPQMAVHLKGPPERTEFWHPITTLPTTLPPEERHRLEQAYRAKIATVIQPAYRRLHDYLATDYLPQARETVGLSALPEGRALYRHLIRLHTTTDLSPEEIHALGKAEVERILHEIDTVQATVGFPGPRGEFLAHIRSDPALHFSSSEEVIPAYRAAAERIVDHLPALFGHLPTIPYDIRPLPPESSQTFQGNGDYAAPAADGSRPGILWMNIVAAGVQDRYTVMTISLHEGRPGHHFQAAAALEQPDLPDFRRSGNYTAFVEGWGLYAESLGKEMGLFEDPWQYYGHLSYAILRANRLVIDTGLHAFGWTVADGVRWMMDHSSMTEEQARDEVERYVAYPGQALAYKVGELKIRALRDEAQRALGEGFDIRRFHDRLLAGGPVPLTDLEADIHRFIDEERTAR